MSAAAAVAVVLLFALLWALVHRACRALGTPPLLTQRTVDLQSLQSGDLLLFDGHHLDAKIVRCWCDAPFSHSGLVFRDRADGTPYVYNSDVEDDDQRCAVCGRCRDGVQMQDLLLKLATYRGRAYHVPLRRPLTDTQLAHWEQWLLPSLCSRRFRYSLLSLLHAALPDLVPLVSADTRYSLLCTELVTLVYRELGIITASMCAGQQSPWRLAQRLHQLGVVDLRRMARVQWGGEGTRK